jgi:hypothetical protein
MSQATTVARLAVREMWVTFRLFVVLAAYLTAGAVVAFLPAPATDTVGRLAIGFGVATIVAAAVAAWSVAAERRSGRTAWLVTRSVARGTYLVGWFAGLVIVAGLGILAGGVLGWLALQSVAVGIRIGDFGLALAAVLAAASTGIALGLAAGSLLRAAVAVGAVAVVGGLVALGATGGGLVLPPSQALFVLPTIVGADPVAGGALRAIGAGLAVTGALLILARLALEHAEL